MTKQQKVIALEQIAEQVRSCALCRANSVGVAVPGEGSANARVVFVGEAPGKNEAVEGRPFIGRSGKLLRERIRDASLKEEDVFITSACKYLPKHVTPRPEEVAHGRTHLMAQLDVIQPKVIVLLGRVAALGVLERDIKIGKEHGTTFEQDGRTYFFAYHPAAALYSPQGKVAFESDMKALAKLVS